MFRAACCIGLAGLAVGAVYVYEKYFASENIIKLEIPEVVPPSDVADEAVADAADVGVIPLATVVDVVVQQPTVIRKWSSKPSKVAWHEKQIARIAQKKEAQKERNGAA